MNGTVPVGPSSDIINSATPLETVWAGVHPRLYFNAERLAALKTRLRRDPWRRFLATVRSSADGGHAPHQALVFLLTGEQPYRDRALAAADQLAAGPGGGHNRLADLALVYDWLFRETEESRRAAWRTVLDREGRALYEQLAKCETYHAVALVWNIGLAGFCSCATAGCALYGDLPKVGPWLRYVAEHARAITAALGPDGVSAEGISYGGVGNEYYLRVIDLVRDLLGDDLYDGNEYLRHLPLAYLYQMLPRRRLGFMHATLCYADAPRYHWCGPDTYLWRIAGLYRDPHAQWAANVLERARACCMSTANAFLKLAWYDHSVRPRSPRALPRLRHFRDKDLVVWRSGWDGDEAVCAFHCGPFAGHHAQRHYTQSIAGGHMAPDAGNLVLYAHGDWLLCDGGYARKRTAYHNTVLVNGVGQTGEGPGDWFECVKLRRERRGPRILRAEERAGGAVITGEATAAYEARAGLRLFRRHLVCLPADVWVLVDELRAAQPSIFELFFHSHGAALYSGHFQPDQPFVPAGPRAWTTGGRRTRLRLTSLAPADAEGVAEVQEIENVSLDGKRGMDCLRLRNTRPLRQAVFVTVLEAFPARRPPRTRLSLRTAGRRWTLEIAGRSGRARVTLAPFRPDPGVAVS